MSMSLSIKVDLFGGCTPDSLNLANIPLLIGVDDHWIVTSFTKFNGWPV